MSDIPVDLKWLANYLTEWPHPRCKYVVADMGSCVVHYECGTQYGISYSRDQWQQARKDLGLEQPEVTEEEERCWKEKEAKHLAEMSNMCGPDAYHKQAKQERYQDAKGEDWIDEFARTATLEEFRGAMRFTIGKYNRRVGKKDEINKEIAKMRDYCDRWLEYENAL